ncbi:MAG: hypothetical protein SGPRY_009999 [Prymnesium sp.]
MAADELTVFMLNFTSIYLEKKQDGGTLSQVPFWLVDIVAGGLPIQSPCFAHCAARTFCICAFAASLLLGGPLYFLSFVAIGALCVVVELVVVAVARGIVVLTSEKAVLNSLRAGANARLHSAHGSAASHLGTALRCVARFREAIPSRVPFVPYVGAGDVHAAAYNEDTWRLFAKFVRSHGSGDLRLRLQLRHMRREDDPAGKRALLSSGLMARLLRRLSLTPREFPRQGQRYAALSWAVLLRGDEFGVVDGKVFVSAAGLVIPDFDWIDPCPKTQYFFAMVVDVMPIKDELVQRGRVQCIVVRRRCKWTADLFVGEAREVAQMIREASSALGETTTDFAARALGIGGATDLYHLFDAMEEQRIIGDRGRWMSNIKDLFSRLSATSMLRVSASLCCLQLAIEVGAVPGELRDSPGVN